MLRIAVCDDEENIRTYLSALVERQGVECEITEYASAGDYLASGTEYDLLILDIELGGRSSDMDGLSLARRIRDMELERQPIILFITGHEKYVYDAFDVNAFQYLVKPVDEHKFAEVFRRAVSGILSEAERQKKALMIQYAGMGRAIPFQDIYYMESQNHKIVLHLKSGELEYYAKLGDLEKELQGQFCRIHKGYLINLSFVEEYSRTEVTLTNREKLLISKYKYADFVKAYLRFMQ